MNPHSMTLLVTAVFTAQILVMSFICPWWSHRAWLAMRRNYPTGDFPRLYPLAPEKVARQNTLVLGLHVVIGLAATVLLAFHLLHGTAARHLVVIMVWTYLVQLLPVVLRMPLLISMHRAFRAMPAPAVRSVELHHWRLTDFVPPMEIALGMSMSVLALGCCAYFYFTGHATRGPGNFLPLLIYSAAISGLLLLRMGLLVAGAVTLRRPDPYMSEADVIRGRKFRLALPFRLAMLLGLYFILMQLYVAGILRLDFVSVMAGTSILGQVMLLRATARSVRSLAARDLNAYRSDPGAAAKKEEAAAASS
ncbi:MAG: hypothetical protein ABI616_09865 [Pseudomonadota bacterium]